MAKQVGHIKLIGTTGNLTFYKMGDDYYARMKSSLTGKQFRTRKCFEGSRRSADRLGTGSRIAGEVYRCIPDEQRIYALFRALKSKAIALLKQGAGEAAAKAALQEFAGVPAEWKPRVLQRKKRCQYRRRNKACRAIIEDKEITSAEEWEQSYEASPVKGMSHEEIKKYFLENYELRIIIKPTVIPDAGKTVDYRETELPDKGFYSCLPDIPDAIQLNPYLAASG